MFSSLSVSVAVALFTGTTAQIGIQECSLMRSGYDLSYVGTTSSSSGEFCYNYNLFRNPSMWGCDYSSDQSWNYLYLDPCGRTRNGRLLTLHTLNEALVDFDTFWGAAYDYRTDSEGYYFSNTNLNRAQTNFILQLCLNQEFPLVSTGDYCFYTQYSEQEIIEDPGEHTQNQYGRVTRRDASSTSSTSGSAFYYVCVNGSLTVPDVCDELGGGLETTTTSKPTDRPTTLPTFQPSLEPSLEPTFQPSEEPTSRPSAQPSFQPTMNPTCCGTEFADLTGQNVEITNNQTLQSSLTTSGLNDGFITNVRVYLNISHMFVGNMIIKLQHVESNKTVVLFDERCICFRNNIDTWIEDAAELSMCGTCDVLDCVLCDEEGYFPYEPLAQLNGESSNSDWILVIEDTTELTDGTLNGWGIDISAEAFEPLPATTDTRLSYTSSAVSPVGAALVENVLNVTGNGAAATVKDVRVYVNIVHSKLNDVKVSLKHVESGVTVLLYDASCGNVCDGGVLDAWFSEDNWVSDVCGQCNQVCAVCDGPYRGIERLTDFDGLEADGEWALVVEDTFTFADTGLLFPWELSFTLE